MISSLAPRQIPSTWRYVKASVVGTSHIIQGLPCQDSSLAEDVGRDHVLLVASDGAGSASLSNIGSRLACDTFHEQITAFIDGGGDVARLNQGTVDQWIEAVIRKLHLQAQATDVPVRELACTLMLALVGPDASAYVHLGDGGIVVLSEGEYMPIAWPAAGEYANTTFFLTDDTAITRITSLLVAPRVDEIALFTDGLQMLALQFETRQAHSPFFRPMFEHLRAAASGEVTALTDSLTDYLGSAAINKRTDDDKTLILATRISTLADRAVPATADAPACPLDSIPPTL